MFVLADKYTNHQHILFYQFIETFDLEISVDVDYRFRSRENEVGPSETRLDFSIKPEILRTCASCDSLNKENLELKIEIFFEKSKPRCSKSLSILNFPPCKAYDAKYLSTHRSGKSLIIDARGVDMSVTSSISLQ